MTDCAVGQLADQIIAAQQDEIDTLRAAGKIVAVIDSIEDGYLLINGYANAPS